MELVGESAVGLLQLVRPPSINPLYPGTIPFPTSTTENAFAIQMSNNRLPSQFFFCPEPDDKPDHFHLGRVNYESMIYDPKSKRWIWVTVVVLPTPMSGCRTNTFLSKSRQDGLLREARMLGDLACGQPFLGKFSENFGRSSAR